MFCILNHIYIQKNWIFRNTFTHQRICHITNHGAKDVVVHLPFQYSCQNEPVWLLYRAPPVDSKAREKMPCFRSFPIWSGKFVNQNTIFKLNLSFVSYLLLLELFAMLSFCHIVSVIHPQSWLHAECSHYVSSPFFAVSLLSVADLHCLFLNFSLDIIVQSQMLGNISCNTDLSSL